MEIATTSTTYPFEFRAVLAPAAGSDLRAVAALREPRAAAPTTRDLHGTSLSSFSRGGSVQVKNKSIVALPQTDVVGGYLNVTDVSDIDLSDIDVMVVTGVPGIRSWSPPV